MIYKTDEKHRSVLSPRRPPLEKKNSNKNQKTDKTCKTRYLYMADYFMCQVSKSYAFMIDEAIKLATIHSKIPSGFSETCFLNVCFLFERKLASNLLTLLNNNLCLMVKIQLSTFNQSVYKINIDISGIFKSIYAMCLLLTLTCKPVNMTSIKRTFIPLSRIFLIAHALFMKFKTCSRVL